MVRGSAALSLWRAALGVAIMVVSVTGVQVQNKKVLRSGASSVYAVYDVLDKLKEQAAALVSNVSEETKSDSDDDSVATSVHQRVAKLASAPQLPLTDRLVLAQALAQAGTTHAMYLGVKNSLITFSNTLQQALGAEPNSDNCAMIQCGAHASCNMDTKKCECEEGFIGDGIFCEAPKNFLPVELFKGDATTKVSEVEAVNFVSPEGAKKVAFVYRDSGLEDRGYLLIADATPSLLKFDVTKALLISGETKAFGPKIVHLGDGRLAISYRDEDKSGNVYCVVVSADGAGAMRAISGPSIVARNQNAAVGTLTMEPTSLIIFYPGETLDTEGKVTSQYGEASVIDVSTESLGKEGAKPAVQGSFRFYEKVVTEVRALPVGPNRFVVAFRGKRFTAGSGEGAKGSGEEASLIVGRLKGGELVFEPELLSVNPQGQQLLNHDLSLVGHNEVAISYFNAADARAEVALIKLHDLKKEKDAEKRMELVQGFPRTILTASEKVQKRAILMNKRSTISMPFVGSEQKGGNTPRTFFFFNKRPAVVDAGEEVNQEVVGRLCLLPKAGEDDGGSGICTDSGLATGVKVGPLSDQTFFSEKTVITGTALGFPGRMAFFFVDADGKAYYQLVAV